jgi:PEP-CTERM motif
LPITLSTPFSYDPSKGNLLMTVDVNGATSEFGEIHFDTNGYNGGAENGNTIMGRQWVYGLNPDHGYGLVTGFNVNVPEPGSFGLLGFGLAAAGLFRRRRQATRRGAGTQDRCAGRLSARLLMPSSR